MEELKNQCETERKNYNNLSDAERKGKDKEDKEAFKKVEAEIKKGIADLKEAKTNGGVSGGKNHSTSVDNIKKRFSNVVSNLKGKGNSATKSKSNSSSETHFMDYRVKVILNGKRVDFVAKIVDSNKKPIPVMEEIDIEIREGRKIINEGHSTTDTMGSISYQIPNEFRGRTIIIHATYKGIKGKYEGSGIHTLAYKVPLESKGETGPLVGEVSEPKTNEKDLSEKQRILEQKAIIEQRVNELLLDLRDVVNQ